MKKYKIAMFLIAALIGTSCFAQDKVICANSDETVIVEIPIHDAPEMKLVVRKLSKKLIVDVISNENDPANMVTEDAFQELIATSSLDPRIFVLSFLNKETGIELTSYGVLQIFEHLLDEAPLEIHELFCTL